MKKQVSVNLVLKAGLLIGSLDILAAFADYYLATGKNPVNVLKFIASGIFGMEAFKGGSGMVVWGLLFHFIIAFTFTVLYFYLYTRLKFVRSQPIIFSLVFALFMWAVTHLAVMPLSNVPLDGRGDLEFWNIVIANLILLFMICLPLAWMARKHFKH